MITICNWIKTHKVNTLFSNLDLVKEEPLLTINLEIQIFYRTDNDTFYVTELKLTKPIFSKLDLVKASLLQEGGGEKERENNLILLFIHFTK